MHQTQHFSTLGHHCQHALQQVAMMGSVANRPQSGGRGMLLVVHFRRILDQQHLPLLARLCSRLRHMRPDELLIAHVGHLQEAIGCFCGRLILHLLRQGGRWMVGDRARDLDGSLRSALIAQVHAAKGVFSPLQGRQQGTRIHQGCSFTSVCLSHSLMNSITSSLESCDKQSGGRPGNSPQSCLIFVVL